MKALFPYIGESVLRSIIAADPGPVVSLFRKGDGLEIVVLEQVQLAFPKAGIKFDGFQKLDIGLLVNRSELIPIEVKLGRNGLHRANIDKVLETGCVISDHQPEKRIAGNMLAVLNRCFDGGLRKQIGADSLHAWVDGGYVPVTDDWCVIARSCILESWRGNPPRFNGRQRFLGLEDICNRFGKDKFNELVAEMLKSENYFGDWIVGGG